MGIVNSTQYSFNSSQNSSLPLFKANEHVLKSVLVFGPQARNENKEWRFPSNLWTNCSNVIHLAHKNDIGKRVRRAVKEATSNRPCTLVFHNTLTRQEFSSGWMLDAARSPHVNIVVLAHYLPRIPAPVLESVEYVAISKDTELSIFCAVYSKFHLDERCGWTLEQLNTMRQTPALENALVIDVVSGDVYAA